MKKVISVFCVLVMLGLLLAACSQKPDCSERSGKGQADLLFWRRAGCD